MHEAVRSNLKVLSPKESYGFAQHQIPVKLVDEGGDDTIKCERLKKSIPYGYCIAVDKYLYELSYETNTPLLGLEIDLTKGKSYYSMEERTIKLIDKYSKRYNKILLIMGTMHTRFVKTGGKYIYYIAKNEPKDADYEQFNELINYLKESNKLNEKELDKYYKMGIGNDGTPILWDFLNKKYKCLQFMKSDSYNTFIKYYNWLNDQKINNKIYFANIF